MNVFLKRLFTAGFLKKKSTQYLVSEEQIQLSFQLEEEKHGALAYCYSTKTM